MKNIPLCFIISFIFRHTLNLLEQVFTVALLTMLFTILLLSTSNMTLLNAIITPLSTNHATNHF